MKLIFNNFYLLLFFIKFVFINPSLHNGENSHNNNKAQKFYI